MTISIEHVNPEPTPEEIVAAEKLKTKLLKKPWHKVNLQRS